MHHAIQSFLQMEKAFNVNMNTNDTNLINNTNPTRLRGYYSVQHIWYILICWQLKKTYIWTDTLRKVLLAAKNEQTLNKLNIKKYLYFINISSLCILHMLVFFKIVFFKFEKSSIIAFWSIDYCYYVFVLAYIVISWPLEGIYSGSVHTFHLVSSSLISIIFPTKIDFW